MTSVQDCVILRTVRQELSLTRDERMRHMNEQLFFLPILGGSNSSPSGEAHPPVLAENRLSSSVTSQKDKKRAYDKARRKANPEKIDTYNKAWRKANPEKVRAYRKTRHESHPEYAKKWYAANVEKIRARCKVYRAANPPTTARKDRKRVWNKAYYEANQESAKAKEKARYAANPDRYKTAKKAWSTSDSPRAIEYRLANNLRRRMRCALNGKDKSASTRTLIGCTWQELRKHIECQFKPGMSWDRRSEFHIDHIIPCAAFDLSDPIQQQECFHFSNLQPLWASENMAKGSKKG